MADPRPHVLFVAYYYPPSTEAGAKRAEGFHRFLADWGYRSTLITIQAAGSQEESGVVRVGQTGFRQGLARAAPKARSRALVAARDLYKEFVDVPDGYRGFYAPACEAAVRVAEKDPVHAVLVTSSPYTSLRIGSALSKRLGVPWVADLRDLWTSNHFGYRFGRIRRTIDTVLERRWLGSASRIITATEGLRHELRLKKLDKPGSTIYNGYLDAPAYAPPTGSKFRISFLGRLYENARHTPQPFFDALEQLRSQRPHVFAKLDVSFWGTQNRELLETRAAMNFNESIRIVPQVEPPIAIAEAARADLLLVLLPDTDAQKVTVPTKIFDYASTRKPILFIGPDGEGASVIRSAGLGRAYGFGDVARIAAWIEELVGEKERGAWRVWGDEEQVAGFHYRERAGRLAGELDAALGR